MAGRSAASAAASSLRDEDARAVCSNERADLVTGENARERAPARARHSSTHAEIVAAFELRHVIRGEWLLAVSGILSIAFGVFAVLSPGAGALAVVTMIGAYAIAFGVLLTTLGFRIHNWATHGELPLGGGTPKHA